MVRDPPLLVFLVECRGAVVGRDSVDGSAGHFCISILPYIPVIEVISILSGAMIFAIRFGLGFCLVIMPVVSGWAALDKPIISFPIHSPCIIYFHMVPKNVIHHTCRPAYTSYLLYHHGTQGYVSQ